MTNMNSRKKAINHVDIGTSKILTSKSIIELIKQMEPWQRDQIDKKIQARH